ncbi:unnamed protein product [Trichogramma brassicae]|uniref:SKP1 component POZ domain-containing protein n=1 Tax=Trichogramma brassicae TaxID=86971 RepID=A0A6H5IL19_9HYME|nr:unnamed protein product [Trichogramma brassicae]
MIIHLKSSDGVIFDLDLSIAKRSGMIKTMIESLGEDYLDEALPLIKIKSNVLKKVIEFATHYKNTPIKEDGESRQITEWDKNFLKIDLETLLDLTDIANYLDMKDLLDYATDAVSKWFAGKSPDAMKEASISFDPNQSKDSSSSTSPASR